MREVWATIHEAAVKEGKWCDFATAKDYAHQGKSYPDPKHNCIVIEADASVYLPIEDDGIMWSKLTAKKRKLAVSQHVSMGMEPYAHMLRARAAHGHPRFTLVCLPGAGICEIGQVVKRILQLDT